jgi:hypothetical protein
VEIAGSAPPTSEYRRHPPSIDKVNRITYASAVYLPFGFDRGVRRELAKVGSTDLADRPTVRVVKGAFS